MAADGFDEFAREVKNLSRALAKLPLELRREMSDEVKEKIAPRLVQRVGRAATMPYRDVLLFAPKIRANPNPTIVVGGTSTGRLSGGATARDVVFGTEYGGGNRVSVVNRKPGKRGRVSKGEYSSGVYKRHTTRQFLPARPYIWETVEKEFPWVLEEWAEIVMSKLYEAVDSV